MSMKSQLEGLFDKKAYRDIGFMLSLLGEYVIYRLGYLHSFKKIEEKDLVIIRYSDWKYRMSQNREEHLSALINIDDLQSCESPATFKRWKYLKREEQLTGMVLRKWAAFAPQTTNKDFFDKIQQKFPNKIMEIAVFTGDAVFIISEEDWLRGIEVITPARETKKSLFEIIRTKLLPKEQ